MGLFINLLLMGGVMYKMVYPVLYFSTIPDAKRQIPDGCDCQPMHKCDESGLPPDWFVTVESCGGSTMFNREVCCPRLVIPPIPSARSEDTGQLDTVIVDTFTADSQLTPVVSSDTNVRRAKSLTSMETATNGSPLQETLNFVDNFVSWKSHRNFPKLPQTVKECGGLRQINSLENEKFSRRSSSWLVSLRKNATYSENSNVDMICYGAFISSQHVLTTASCINAGYTQIGGFVTKSVTKHEDFDIPNYETLQIEMPQNDIGLIKVEETETTKQVHPACLPFWTVYGTDWKKEMSGDRRVVSVHVNGTLFVTFQKVPVLENEFCRQMYRNTFQVIEPGQLCTIEKFPYVPITNECGNIRSGFVLTSRHFLQVGITSWTVTNRNACTPHVPVVYTRVEMYLEWILENL